MLVLERDQSTATLCEVQVRYACTSRTSNTRPGAILTIERTKIAMMDLRLGKEELRLYQEQTGLQRVDLHW